MKQLWLNSIPPPDNELIEVYSVYSSPMCGAGFLSDLILASSGYEVTTHDITSS